MNLLPLAMVCPSCGSSKFELIFEPEAGALVVRCCKKCRTNYLGPTPSWLSYLVIAIGAAGCIAAIVMLIVAARSRDAIFGCALGGAFALGVLVMGIKDLRWTRNFCKSRTNISHVPQPEAIPHPARIPVETLIWDDSEYGLSCLACISATTFYLSEGIATGTANLIPDAIDRGESVNEIFKRGTIIPLDAISELRCSDSARTLEIYWGKRRPQLVHTSANNIYREIYQRLRLHLGSTTPPIQGRLSRLTATTVPLIALGITAVLGGVMILAEATKDPNDACGKGWLRDLLNRVTASLGVWGLSGITLVLSSVFLGWLLFRLRSPHTAEIVRITGAPRSNVSEVNP